MSFVLRWRGLRRASGRCLLACRVDTHSEPELQSLRQGALASRVSELRSGGRSGNRLRSLRHILGSQALGILVLDYLSLEYRG